MIDSASSSSRTTSYARPPDTAASSGAGSRFATSKPLSTNQSETPAARVIRRLTSCSPSSARRRQYSSAGAWRGRSSSSAHHLRTAKPSWLSYAERGSDSAAGFPSFSAFWNRPSSPSLRKGPWT